MTKLRASKAVVLLSGGLDSSALLYATAKAGHEVFALSVHYGQRHERELHAAAAIAERAGVSHRVVDLSLLKPILAGSSQTSDDVDVPEGHYADETMKLTVVPNRNMILISIAVAYAVSLKAPYVAYAAHAGDHAIYPDCRPEFITRIARAIEVCDYEPPILVAPYKHISKSQIVTEGTANGVPFELTWSCYKGDVVHCGKCGTCVERREAFSLARIADPTVYSA